MVFELPLAVAANGAASSLVKAIDHKMTRFTGERGEAFIQMKEATFEGKRPLPLRGVNVCQVTFRKPDLLSPYQAKIIFLPVLKRLIN